MMPAIGPDALWESRGNPAPGGAALLPVTTRDGVVLRTASWRPDGRSRGTILLLQGRAEFIEKYFETIGELISRGFVVVAFDWRGQGSSGRAVTDGRKGHIRHFDDFRLDLEAVAGSALRAHAPPHLCLAHSMGGCIALTAAAEGWLPASRLVALTPMVALSLVRYPRLARTVARVLTALGLADRFVPGSETRSISTLPFAGNRLSGDETRYARNALVAEALGAGAIGSPTIGWVRAAYEAMERLGRPGFGAGITIPTLIVGAGDDPVCATPAIERFARSLGPHGLYLPIAGSRHEILMETDAIRARFWEAFDRFAGAAGPASAVEEIEELRVENAVAAGENTTAADGRTAVP